MKIRTSFAEAQNVFDQVKKPGNVSENEKIQRITDIFTVLRQKINECEKTLKEQVRAREKRNKTLADNYCIFLNTRNTELLKHRTDFEEMVSSNDYIQLLGAKTRLTDYLNQLTKEMKVLKPPMKIECQLKDVDRLHSGVGNILKNVVVGE